MYAMVYTDGYVYTSWTSAGADGPWLDLTVQSKVAAGRYAVANWSGDFAGIDCGTAGGTAYTGSYGSYSYGSYGGYYW